MRLRQCHGQCLRPGKGTQGTLQTSSFPARGELERTGFRRPLCPYAAVDRSVTPPTTRPRGHAPPYIRLGRRVAYRIATLGVFLLENEQHC